MTSTTGRGNLPGRTTTKRDHEVGSLTAGRELLRRSLTLGGSDQRARLRRRAIGLGAVDGGAWCVGIVVAGLLRPLPDPALASWRDVATFLPLAVAVALAVGLLAHLYGGRFVTGSADEAQTLGLTDALVMLIVLALDLVLSRPVPVSVVVGAGVIAFVLSAGARFGWRRRREAHRRPSAEHATRLLVMGAGEAGASIVKQLLHDRDSQYVPVGFIEDDAFKRHLRIAGVPVLGSRGELAEIATRVGAQALLMAIPGASVQLVREVSDLSLIHI